MNDFTLPHWNLPRKKFVQSVLAIEHSLILHTTRCQFYEPYPPRQKTEPHETEVYKDKQWLSFFS